MSIFPVRQWCVVCKSGRSIYSKLLLLVELDHDSWLHCDCGRRPSYGARMRTVILMLFVSQNSRRSRGENIQEAPSSHWIVKHSTDWWLSLISDLSLSKKSSISQTTEVFETYFPATTHNGSLSVNRPRAEEYDTVEPGTMIMLADFSRELEAGMCTETFEHLVQPLYLDPHFSSPISFLDFFVAASSVVVLVESKWACSNWLKRSRRTTSLAIWSRLSRVPSSKKFPLGNRKSQRVRRSMSKVWWNGS